MTMLAVIIKTGQTRVTVRFQHPINVHIIPFKQRNAQLKTANGSNTPISEDEYKSQTN